MVRGSNGIGPVTAGFPEFFSCISAAARRGATGVAAQAEAGLAQVAELVLVQLGEDAQALLGRARSRAADGGGDGRREPERPRKCA